MFKETREKKYKEGLTVSAILIVLTSVIIIFNSSVVGFSSVFNFVVNLTIILCFTISLRFCHSRAVLGKVFLFLVWMLFLFFLLFEVFIALKYGDFNVGILTSILATNKSEAVAMMNNHLPILSLSVVVITCLSVIYTLYPHDSDKKKYNFALWGGGIIGHSLFNSY